MPRKCCDAGLGNRADVRRGSLSAITGKPKASAMTLPSNLEDPDVARHAWRRYRRLMLWMATVALLTTTIALTVLRLRNPDASVHLYIAAAAGIFLSVLLGTALMGLVFLSAGTGHDESIEDRLEDERQKP